MDKSTQETQILAYMMNGHTITPLEALNQFGCMRLGARIFDLKHKGINIESKMIERNGKHFSGYSIAGVDASGA